MNTLTCPKVALLAIAKNENWYINDWVKYHLELGFNKIFIYDNNDFEDIGLYIDEKYNGKVQIFDIHGMKQCQNTAYGLWWNEYRKDYDWVAIIDVDEFIVFADKTKSIREIMSNPGYIDYDNVRLNWVLYGDNDCLYGDLSKPVYERITKKSSYKTALAKSIVNCHHSDVLSIIGAHAALRKDNSLVQCLPNLQECKKQPTANGLTPSVDKIDTSIMWIAHYITRTVSEYKVNKYGRTDAYFVKFRRYKEYFFNYSDWTQEKQNILSMTNEETLNLSQKLEKTWTNKPINTIVERMPSMNSLELLCNQTRFDLIYKYLYAKNRDNKFNKIAYYDSILAFNDFNEYAWKEGKQDKRTKHGVSDFGYMFDSLIWKAENGRFSKKPACMISSNGHVIGGAHRLAVSAAFGLELDCNKNKNGKEFLWDYSFFRKKGLNECLLDYGALNMVKLNPNAYVLNVFPVADWHKDGEVEKTLQKNGVAIYYKKIISDITLTGMVNLNKMFYRESGTYASWIGNDDNRFQGAQNHGKRKMEGKNRFRVYVIFCESLEKIKEVKEQIRQIYGVGHASCHINDFHSGAIELAETLFNENSLHWLNHCEFEKDNNRFNQLVDDFKKHVSSIGNNIDDYVLVGSCPLDAYMIRQSKDIDFFFKGKSHASEGLFYQHDSQKKFYSIDKQTIIENPKYHFWYRGMKILSLDAISEMKTTRNEIGKDDVDVKLINKFI